MKMGNIVHENHYLPLLIIFISWFVISPFIGFHELDAHIVNALFLLVLGSALYAFKGKPQHILFKIIIPAGIVLMFFAKLFTDSQFAQIGFLSFLIFFIIALFISILSDIIFNKSISANTLIGACCSYFLIGLLFGAIYMIIDKSVADSFAGSLNENNRDRPLLYFSYVTLTTLGYGDISPISPIARSVATLQAIVGQLYLTILMAILVGSYINGKNSTD